MLDDVIPKRVNLACLVVASGGEFATKTREFLEVLFQERGYFVVVDGHKDAHRLLDFLQEPHLFGAFLVLRHHASISKVISGKQFG